MDNQYIKLISKLEEIQRFSFKILRKELIKLGIEDLRPLEVIFLCQINTNKFCMGNLLVEKLYLGTNPNYIVNKLIDRGYLNKTPVLNDKRMKNITLSERGHHLISLLKNFFDTNDIAFNNGILEKIYNDLLQIEEILEGQQAKYSPKNKVSYK